MIRGGGTHEADKHLVARIYGNLAAAVIDYRMSCRLPVRAKGSIQTDAFHAVVEQLLIALVVVFIPRNALDFGKMGLTLLRQIEVDDLGELPANGNPSVGARLSRGIGTQLTTWDWLGIMAPAVGMT
jgi:hypothetical protein